MTRDSLRKLALHLDIFMNKDEIDEIFQKASSDGKVISF